MSEEREIFDDEGYVVDIEKQDQKVEPPRPYMVVMMNDDFTPMDFVVEVLQSHFGKTPEAAAMIMLSVHQKGRGVAGTYPKDIAETKAELVNQYAQTAGHPFKCEAEQA